MQTVLIRAGLGDQLGPRQNVHVTYPGTEVVGTWLDVVETIRVTGVSGQSVASKRQPKSDIFCLEVSSRVKLQERARIRR